MKWAARAAWAVLVAAVALGTYIGVWNWIRSGTAPRWLTVSYDRVLVRAGAADPHTRCYLPEERTSDGYSVLASLPDRQCYDWQPARRFRGFYIDEFEGQRFIEGGASRLPLRPRDNVWLEKDHLTDASIDPRLKGWSDLTKVWSVELIGRKTARSGRYGHLGASAEELLVDRFTSARLLHEQEGYLSERVLVR